MAKQFTVYGAALIITDSVSGIIELEAPKRDVYFDNRELKNDIIRLYDTNGTSTSGSSLYEVDIAETSYTQESFREFARLNMGFGATGQEVSEPSIVNKFGFNADIDTGGEEVIASFGGTFNIMTTADTLNFVSSDSEDTAGGLGANILLIQGVSGDNLEIQEYIVPNGTTPVTTVNSYLGVNRIYVVSSGSDNTNIGDITVTDTSGTFGVQAQIPAGASVTQQCIYHIPIGKTFNLDFLNISAIKIAGGGGTPELGIQGYTFSRVTNTVYNVINLQLDLARENNIVLNYKNPITFTGREVVYFTAETDTNNTKMSLRFSGEQTDS